MDISALVDDIGAGLTADPPQMRYSPSVFNTMYPNLGGIGALLNDEMVSDPPSWLSTVANTGLEAFRVREGRRAMRNRPLAPDEASLFTRPNNQSALSPFGTGPMVMMLALGVVAIFALRK